MTRRRLLRAVAVAVALVGAMWAVWGPQFVGHVMRRSTLRNQMQGLVALNSQKSPDAGLRNLDGVVIDPDGKRAVGVKVRVSVAPPELALRVATCQVCGRSVLACTHPATVMALAKALRERALSPPVLAETVSDGHGHFHFEGVPNVSLRVTGFAMTSKSAGAIEVSPTELKVSLVLQEATSFKVKATTVMVGDTELYEPEVRPLSGAWVLAYDEELDESFEGVTNAAGQFAVVTAAERLWVLIEHEGFLSKVAAIPREGSVGLRRLVSLTVRTVNGTQPIEAEVEMRQSDEPSDPHALRLRTVKGLAHFVGLAPQEWSIIARAPPLVSVPTDWDAEPQEITLNLEPAGRLTLVVLDDQGQPQPDVAATLFRDAKMVATSNNTNEGQPLTFGPLPIGLYAIQLSLSVGEMRGTIGTAMRGVEIVAGESTLKIVMPTPLLLSARVLTADARPVADATVRLVDPLVNAGPNFSTKSDENGFFAIEVPEAGLWSIAVTHVEGAAERTVTVPGAPVDVQLERRGCLHIIAHDGRGDPVTDAMAHVGPSSLRLNGEARICGLTAGEVPVMVGGYGYLLRKLKIQVGVGTTHELRVRLAKSGQLKGRVLDEVGRPVVGANIVEADGEPSDRYAFSQTNGLFESDALEVNHTYTLIAQREGYEPGRPVTATVPSEGLEFRVKELPRITGRVVGSSGVPVNVFSVNENDVTSVDGRFSITRAQNVFVRAAGYRDHSQPVLDDATDVGDVVLRPELLLTGLVVDAEGRPVQGATVTSRSVECSVTTDERGEFTCSLKGGEPNNWVEVVAQLHRLWGQALAQPGKRLTLRLMTPTRVNGRVIGAEGRGVEVIIRSVGSRSNDWWSTSLQTAPDGTFAIELKPQLYQFSTRLTIAREIEVAGPMQAVVLGQVESTPMPTP